MPGKITADIVLSSYARGYFPMAESRDDPRLFWFYPKKRGVIPLGDFHVSESLARFMKKEPFTITVDKAFTDVIRGCAEPREKGEGTWINDTIITLYTELHEKGFAHSVECWEKPQSADCAAVSPAPCEGQQARSGGNPKLVGGIYGIALGGAFFGESMFSRSENASKVALVTLLTRLRDAGYVLFDTQYVNEHLKQFGVMEIARKEYLQQLEKALQVNPASIF